jgi:peptidoglycan biosynthesis protein MviN/MurJ (putative lipid II flippase)
MGPLGHSGLALALTFSAVFNSIALLWALQRKIGNIGLRAIGLSFLKVVPATAIMAVVVWFVLGIGQWTESGAAWQKSLILLAALGSGMVVYLLCCLALRVPEASAVAAIIKRKLGK